ncbi:hypothetical protein M514_10219 [Trichuris suis]|uniref:Uncharacterized protein n=1 Tax=Trichuris suis TaxID=68888 RepID=A0A085LV60_9BILA|nr:hypothetical protein M513_10219 [Trichuris suis]KFD66245.1 hypothetical protein M514_10219 [Trichuris suis]
MSPSGYRRFIGSRFVDSRFVDSRFVDSRFVDNRFVDKSVRRQVGLLTGRFVDRAFCTAQLRTKLV